ncbi:TonB-dependent receptor [Elongatibacter sediminis]|uniref:TonB-dependent receptor n=1 Tax=Elongatibacter sediminis TaxID=3119006 RepID=A0AAW9REN8_9GAMM
MTNKYTPGRLLLNAGVLALTACSVAAWAQQPTASERAEIEEVIVTATKRGAESVQDVPISITAFSQTLLENKGVDSFEDFANLVPGLSYEDAGPGDKTFIVRGINSTGTGVATVGQYIDEILVTGDLRQPDLRLFDVERIEVLRGPQGTLYGSGSLSGTIRVVTNKPDPTRFATTVRLEGSHTRNGGEDYEASAMVNLPLVEDTLALRVVGYHRDYSGFIDNVRLGEDRVNDEETSGGRAVLRWTPNDDMTLTASAYFQDTRLGGRNIFTTADGTLGEFNTDQYVHDPFDDDFEIYNLTWEQRFSLGTLTASTSYFDRRVSDNFDSTPFNQQFGEFLFLEVLGLPTINGLTNQTDTSELFTNEIRFATDLEGPVNAVVGLFYQEIDTTFDTLVASSDDAGFVIQPVLPIFGEFLAHSTDQFAVFGEISYDINEQWTALVGARYFTADQKDDRVNTFPFGGFNPPSVEPTVNTSSDKFTPKFYVSYAPNDDRLYFATVSQGFRVGGGNQNPIFPLPEENQNYDPDQLWNFELGAKTEWFDNRLRVNSGIYYILWEDIQVADFTDDANSFTFTSNAGEARAYGLELEIAAQLTERWDLTTTLSYVNAELTEDQPSLNPETAARDGDKFPNTPEWSGSFSAQYQWPMTNGWDGFFRADAAYVGDSETQFNPENPISNHKDDYVLTNLRLGIRAESWDATLFVNNLFDELAEVNIIEQASNLTPRAIVAARPRRVGVSLTYHY